MSIYIETIESREIDTQMILKDIPYAMLFSVIAVCNQRIILDPSEFTIIFAIKQLGGNFSDTTFYGCGEINPLTKDSNLRTISIGTSTRILMKTSVGYDGVVHGILSSSQRPNSAELAHMHFIIPIVFGQSDRVKALQLVTLLKTKIVRDEFFIGKPVDKLRV